MALRRKRSRGKTEKMRRFMARWGKELGKMVPGMAAFFLLSIAKCFAIPSPYAICCLAALVNTRVRPRGAVAGVVLGVIFRMIWGIPWEIEQLMACLICIPVMKRRFKNRWGISAAAGIILCLKALPGIIRAQESQSVILHLISIFLGMISMPALSRTAQLIRKKKKEMEEDDLLCLLLPALLMIAGAARLMIFGANLGYMISVALVLLLAWIAGAAVGIFVGMGCGAALLLGGQSALMLVTLSFGALIAGFFQRKNRLFSAGGFLLGATAMTYLTSFSFYPALFFSGLAAAVFFVLFPRRTVQQAVYLARCVCWSKPRDNAYTRLKMQRWVRAIEKIADALPHPPMEKENREEESETIMERLCLECDQLPICWHEHYDQTKEGVWALAQRREPDGYLSLINRHFSACPRISRIPGILHELDAARQKSRQRAICAEYERDMLKTHLTALSQAAQLISLEGRNEAGEEEYWLSQVEEAMHALKFPGEAAFAKRVDGRMTACLKCDPLALHPSSVEALKKHIGVRLQAVMQVTENKNGRIVLEEEAPLQIHTGMATACAMVQEQEEREKNANGDAVLVRQLSGGKVVLALSDGMGHGAGAQDESRKTLEMLGHCMEAGYQRDQAMTAVNGMMLSATGGEKFATVDFCMVDLWTGETTLDKLGACASVLVQGQKMHIIEGAALPLGIIEHVAPMEHQFSLGEGDILFMMSDGITDAFEQEADLLKVLQNILRESPQRMADILLKAAIDRRAGCPTDDMTVLCARIASSHPERKKRYAIA